VFDALDRYGEDARILAGGQSLLAALNLRLAAPSVLIDINALDELAGVAVDRGLLRIGALTRHRTLERSPEVAQHAPLITQAIANVGHPAIRNRGTFGGSIAFADPAAELPACCVALEATIVVASRRGERRVAAREFFTGLYETALGPGELVLGAEIPVAQPASRTACLELARRHGDYAIVGVLAHAQCESARYRNVRLVFFAVGPTPRLATHACTALEGQAFSAELVEGVQAALERDLAPDGDLYHTAATKMHLARVLAGRAVAKLAGAYESRHAA
jgi:carbon-monoxide dehydrogenase medium subunit